MLGRNEFIVNILELYDKLEKSQEKITVVEECKEESNPVFEMLATIGMKQMSKDLIEGWHFREYAPKVSTEEGTVLTYEQWKALVKPASFDASTLVNYLNSKVTFEDILRVLDSSLYKFYDKKIGELNSQ